MVNFAQPPPLSPLQTIPLQRHLLRPGAEVEEVGAKSVLIPFAATTTTTTTTTIPFLSCRYSRHSDMKSHLATWLLFLAWTLWNTLRFYCRYLSTTEMLVDHISNKPHTHTHTKTSHLQSLTQLHNNSATIARGRPDVRKGRTDVLGPTGMEEPGFGQ